VLSGETLALFSYIGEEAERGSGGERGRERERDSKSIRVSKRSE
jgi:hypothetical protein